ncbi:Autophagy protein 5 [Ascochyta lentis]
MGSRDVTSRLRESVWNGSIPLEVRLHNGDCRTYDDSDPYLIQFPRLSYLGLLIHNLHNFFSPNLIYPDVSPADLWLSYEGVPLKWHYPLGLLYDLYSGAGPAYPSDLASPSSPSHGTESSEDEHRGLPWKLTVHFSDYPAEQLVRLDTEDKVMHDLFRNNIKEADYLRNGTGKTVMFLSEKDSTQLWDAVKQHDFSLYNPINQKLLNPQGAALRHLPVRIYLPHAANGSEQKETSPGSLRVVQSLVTPNLPSRQPQTIGTALNQILPTLFPSRRSPLLAQAVLHGAVLPLSASVEDLLRVTAYMDGWLHIAVVMMA